MNINYWKASLRRSKGIRAALLPFAVVRNHLLLVLIIYLMYVLHTEGDF
jgi:hypothetical protein